MNKEYNIFLSNVIDPYISSICNKTPFPVIYHIIKYAKEELNKDLTSTSLIKYCPEIKQVTCSNKINEQYIVQPSLVQPSLVQPSLVQPSLSRYIYFVCVLYIFLYGLIYICKN